MVKVLLFPLFPSHNVVPCAEEPLSVISTGDLFLVATAANTLNIYGKKGEALGRFQTQESIFMIRYLPSIDAVVTLESGPQKQRTVRLYRNWQPGSSGGLIFTVSIRRRLGPRYLVLDGNTSIDVTEAGSLQVLFLFQIDISSPASFISLHDTYLAYATATEVAVLDVLAEVRTVEQGPNALETPMRRQATVILDPNGSVVAPLGVSLTVPPFERAAPKTSEPAELIGVSLRDMQHAAFANTEAGYELSRNQTILYRRFAANERIISLSLRALSPVPSAAQLERGEAPAVSEVQLFVSTKQAGFLYQLASPTLSRTRLLTTYLYTGDTATVHMGDVFLYTLSKNGLEVWTLRAATEGEEAEQPPPCIVNMQALMYVQQTAISRDLTVMLLSKYDPSSHKPDTDVASSLIASVSEVTPPPVRPASKSKPVAGGANSGRPSAASPPSAPKLAIDDFVLISDRDKAKTEVAWNIQLLEVLPLLSLAAEMRAYAAEKAETNPSVFYQLAVEIYLLFGATISNLVARYRFMPPGAERDAVWREIGELVKEHRRAATELAEHYKKTRSFEVAAHLYAHSSLESVEVLGRLFGTDDTERRLRAVAAYLQKIGHYEVLTKEQADQLLAYLAGHTPGVLPPLILASRVPSFDQVALLRALEPVMALEAAASGEMLLTCAALAYAGGNDARAATSLRSLDADTLYRLLSNYPSLLQPREGRTALWRALGAEYPWSLLEAVEKHRATITIAQALTVLGGAPLSAGDAALAHSTDLLFLFLHSTLQSSYADASHSLGDSALLLALLLVRDVQSPRPLPHAVLEVPMRRSGSHNALTTPSPKHSPPSSPRSAAAAAEARAVDRLRASLVRERHRWLDALPPFALQQQPADPFSTSVTSSPPPSFFFLRKLQGLLCSPWAQHIDFKPLIAAVNGAKAEFPGRFSLRLLCLPRLGALAEAAPSLVAAYPLLTADFGDTVCRTPEDWRVLNQALLQVAVSPDRPIRVSGLDTSPATCIAAYQALLEHLSTLLSPAEFVSTLPPNGSLQFFMPYVERCHRHMRAELLRKKIVDEQLAVLREEEKAAQHSS